jgi:hypothetical protein
MIVICGSGDAVAGAARPASDPHSRIPRAGAASRQRPDLARLDRETVTLGEVGRSTGGFG